MGAGGRAWGLLLWFGKGVAEEERASGRWEGPPRSDRLGVSGAELGSQDIGGGFHRGLTEADELARSTETHNPVYQ